MGSTRQTSVNGVGKSLTLPGQVLPEVWTSPRFCNDFPRTARTNPRTAEPLEALEVHIPKPHQPRTEIHAKEALYGPIPESKWKLHESEGCGGFRNVLRRQGIVDSWGHARHGINVILQ